MSARILVGDCRVMMATLPDASVDAVVCDPPYELGFMGKAWDASGIAYDVEVWRQALRVLKPGGHLLAFSGSRTYHRMTCAIEDAGFEIRDQIMWVYGSGFPKSLDVSKAIDNAAGAEREVVGLRSSDRPNRHGGHSGSLGGGAYTPAVETVPATDAARQWSGWGTALKPAHEPICMARKPLVGTVAANVLAHGTGAIHVDGCRVGDTVETWPSSRSYPYGDTRTYGSNDAPIERTQAAPSGRWPANFIHDGSEEVVGLFPQTTSGAWQQGMIQHSEGFKVGERIEGKRIRDARAPDIGSAARFFYTAKASREDREDGCAHLKARTGAEAVQREEGSPGTKSPGAGAGRTAASIRNHHPTVKPTELMRYLCRLVTPLGGTVLDPFTGSGSTGRGAVLEGFSFIGCELSPEYAEIAQARIRAVAMPLFPVEVE